VATPNRCTTNWWLFPPRTQEIQYDEKWSFVEKKQEQCDSADPADQQRGECWDHVGYDPEHRLVLSAVVGKRTAENCREVVADVRRRTGGIIPRLITSDEYPAYKVAIQQEYGLRVVPLTVLPKPKGRPRVEKKVLPKALNYATAHKTREQGRVVKVERKIVFGTQESVSAALKQSSVSKAVNTSFLERQNATDRHHNARKARCTYCFSKGWVVHQMITWFTLFSYNFCWPVRTLASQSNDGRRRPTTPAMAAGLSDHLWTIREWCTMPAVQSG
jgi:IS1 family transposase